MHKYQIKGLISLSLLAAFVATICDAFHVYTATLSYPNPLFFNQAWWVFPGFFIAFAGMAINYIQLIPPLSKSVTIQLSQTKGTVTDLVESLMLFVMVYLLSAFGNTDPKMLSIIFYFTFFIRLFFSYERTWLFIIAILLGVGGMLGEGILSAFGLVAYRHQDIFYVPWWLGGLYMHGAFALRAGIRYFLYEAKIK